jgi:hypothetical protein
VTGIGSHPARATAEVRSGAGARVASARWITDDPSQFAWPRRYAVMTSDFLAADAVGSSPARLSVADVVLCPAAEPRVAALRAVLRRSPGCLLAITPASGTEMLAGTRDEVVTVTVSGRPAGDGLLAAAALAYGWLVSARLPLAGLVTGHLTVAAASTPGPDVARLDGVLSVRLGVGYEPGGA